MKIHIKQKNCVEQTNKLTTIAISHKNYSILKRLGQTGDSFNDVLGRLLKNNSLLESDIRVEDLNTRL